MDTTIKKAKPTDKEIVLKLLDEFRTDCIEQITGKVVESHTARTGGSKIYDALLARQDYCVFLLFNCDSENYRVFMSHVEKWRNEGGS